MMEALPLLMFAVLLSFILLGYPVAFTLAGTALGFAVIGNLAGVFYWTDLGFIPTRIFGVINNFTLVAVPLFVFMGLTLEKSGLAEDLLKTMARMFSTGRGALAISVVFVGAILAASTGIVGATVVTMGILSLPTMIQQGYSKSFACGTIAASGTLGQIIPPSIVLVLLGDMMNVDVGDLFVAAVGPGLLLVGLYLVYIKCVAIFKPELAPLPVQDDSPLPIGEILGALVPPALLIAVVLGSILFGIASPTEAAACGASGGLIVAGARRRLSWKTLFNIAEHTARITAMVFMILVGAQFFGVVFRGLAGDEIIINLITELSLHPTFVLLAIMVLLFVLGFFLDFLEICFIVIPVILPVMTHLGYDPLWLAVLIAINLQTSFLTPPFGFALFYLKGVAPESVTTQDIYRGIIPFVGIQALALILVLIIPELATYLPRIVFP